MSIEYAKLPAMAVLTKNVTIMTTFLLNDCPELKATLKRQPVKKAGISSSSDAVEYIRHLWEGLDIYETVYALFLNRANHTIGWYKVSQGGLTGTVCDPRLIMKVALDNLATNIILFHNHPSGNLKPSRADEEITKKLKGAAALFDIVLNDHIIITEEGYYSFCDEGML